MTRFPYDRFSKDYLKELLSPFGEVETSRDVAGEVREIDVWFAPLPQPGENLQAIGLLGRLAATSSIFEPFRNPATSTEIRGCMSKLFNVCAYTERQARRDNTRINHADLPQLWILSPTASVPLLNGFGARLDEDNWGAGIYFLHEQLRTAIVAIHQLPRTSETLWLRLLGKGRVQEQAIDEVEALPVTHPLRFGALELLSSLKTTLEVSQDLEPEDRELIMRLSPLYVQRLEEATQQGVQQGIQQGVQQGQRILVENLLRVRFGELDAQLGAIIESILELPTEEYTPLLLQSSREELLARFGN